MKILLIGHRGYIGSGLLEYFSANHDVLGWDKEEDLFKLDSDLLKAEQIDMVVNLSLALDRDSDQYSVDTPGDRINVEGARHLARILRGSDIAWIQMSTREVFGPVYGPDDVISTPDGDRPKFLVNETQPYAPRNAYGKSKVIAEFIAESHPYSNVIRLTTGYTDQDHPSASWPLLMIKNAVAGKPFTLTRGGEQFRDPLHSDDLGRLMELLYERQVFGEKFNAGGGAGSLISLKEFVRVADPNASVQSAEGGDFGFAFDNAKATSLTGWEPKVKIRERLPKIIASLKESS